MEVEVVFPHVCGAFYKATVVGVDTDRGKALLSFENRWKPTTWVKLAHIRYPPQSDTGQRFVVGTIVEALLPHHDNEPPGWWTGTLLKSKGNLFVVEFQSGNETYQDIIERDKLRLPNDNPPLSTVKFYQKEFPVPEDILAFCENPNVHDNFCRKIKALFVSFEADKKTLTVLADNERIFHRADILYEMHFRDLKDKMQLLSKNEAMAQTESSHSLTMSTPIEAASEALRKVDDQLECAICLQPYTEPKLLPCFHVFCKHCLTQLVVKSRDGSTVMCPQCRRPTPLPPSGVTGLQSAFHVHHLFDIRDTLEKIKEPQKVPCDYRKCNKATATGYCRDCGKFVCGKCTMAHEFLDSLASHQIVSIADIQADTTILVPPKRKVMYCPRHPKKKLKIYCETCQELICSDCTIGLHPCEGHQYNLIADCFPKHRDDIIAHLKPVRQHLQTVNKALQSLDTRKNEVSDQRQAIEANIHRRIDQLHQVLDQRRAELVGQLDRLTQQKLKNLAAQKDQIELLQTQLSSCLEYVEGSLKTGTEGEILAMKAPIVRQIQQIVSEVNPDMFQPQEMADMLLVVDDAPRLTETCCTFAAVTTSTDPTQCYATGDGLETATVGEIAQVTLHTRDKDGRGSDIQTAGITTEQVCSHDNTKIKCNVTKVKGSKYLIRYQPVTRGKHHLHIMIGGRQTRGSPHTVAVRPKLEALGKPVKVIGDLREPLGITTNSKGMVIVVENGAKCVSVFTPEGEKVRSFGSEGGGNGQFNHPMGVAVDRDDNIYVVDNCNHCIQKFKPNGEYISSVGSRGGNQLQFQWPVGIGFNCTNSKLYVCDQLNYRVQVLDTNFAFSQAFGTRGSGNGQFLSPMDVAFDADGHIYIADIHNHRIQVFTVEGQYLRQFGSKEQLMYPSSIAIDRDTVYVTERDNCRVSIFTTTGQFVHSFGSKGQEPGQLNAPWGVTVDQNGFILVSDRDNNRIQIY